MNSTSNSFRLLPPPIPIPSLSPSRNQLNATQFSLSVPTSGWKQPYSFCQRDSRSSNRLWTDTPIIGTNHLPHDCGLPPVPAIKNPPRFLSRALSAIAYRPFYSFLNLYFFNSYNIIIKFTYPSFALLNSASICFALASFLISRLP